MKKNIILERFIIISIFAFVLISFLTASTLMAEAGSLEISKTWGKDDKDEGVAPEMVIVDLYNNANNEVAAVIYLTESGNWEKTINNLAVGEYTAQERPVNGFDTSYPDGNIIQITASNDVNNPAELMIENKYIPPRGTFTLTIYNVSITNGNYEVIATICSDQKGGIDQDFHFSNEESDDGSLAVYEDVMLGPGECQQITFTFPLTEIDLNQTYYIGYSNIWKEIGQPQNFIPIATNKLADLDFGTFSPANGTITVNPTGGLSIGNGYSGYHDGDQQPAEVEVIWLPNAQYNLSFSNQITISHDQNNNMTVSNFTVDNNSNILDQFGYDSFNIGATVNVENGLDSGLYSGQFFVTVSFE